MISGDLGKQRTFWRLSHWIQVSQGEWRPCESLSDICDPRCWTSVTMTVAVLSFHSFCSAFQGMFYWKSSSIQARWCTPCPEVLSWSSLAWGYLKWKVRNTWLFKGTQNAQVLMELAGVPNLESWSFGTWFRLTACGYSCYWRIGPLVRGKGCECLEFCSLTKPDLFWVY